MSEYSAPYLKELDLTHAARCAELEHVLFPLDTPWSEAIFADSIRAPHTFFLGAFVTERTEWRRNERTEWGSNERTEEDEDKREELLVGYVGIGMVGPADSPEFEIHSIGTDQAFQRRGIGSMLMDNVVHVADLKNAPIFLEVRTDNAPAIALYEKYGFEKMGIRKNYYNGADALTMKRESHAHSGN